MSIWIGYEHLDRLITYPYPRNLSGSAQPIRMSKHRPGKQPLSDQLWCGANLVIGQKRGFWCSACGVDRCLRCLQADAGAVPVGLDGVESPALGDHLEFGCAQLWERGRGRVGRTGWNGGN